MAAVVVLSTSTEINAQSPTEQMNAELRHLFQHLNNPNPTVHFLYDRSAHVVDSIFFTHLSYDTSNVDNWYNLYSEMYYAAYDTTAYAKADTVFNRSFPLIQNDTVPIGIIDWRFNRLKPDALTTDNYFIFDTVNNVLYDKSPQPITPYVVDTLFAAAPLVREVPFANVIFKVSEQFMFIDATTDYAPDARTLKIDFDDGNGWITFTHPFNEAHTVNYPSSGLKAIKIATFDPFNNNLISFSTSVLNVLSATITVPPDDFITGIPGIDVAVFDNNCNPNMMKKYVVYLEGYDFINSRSASQIYTSMIKNKEVAQLRNFGYTFVVVSWHNANQAIQNNAMAVVQLLDYLKCQNDSVPPFVVIGESMGGLVGKYALAYMEAPDYQAMKDPWTCKKALLHNTRLLMTYDSPHQGANIPIGIQQMYKYAAPMAYMFSAFHNGIGNLYNNGLLNGTSAKQMLIYHVETEDAPLALVNSSTYHHAAVRENFLLSMAALGNYPKYCKMVAFSNGALNGNRQTRTWDGADRQPNDLMMNMETDFYLRVLGMKFVGSHTALRVRTNPSGNGEVFHLSKGMSRYKLKLKWFGIKLEWTHNTLIKIQKEAESVRAHCVSAGSNLGTIATPFNTASTGSANALGNLFGLDYDYNIDGHGNIQFTSSLYSLLMPWLMGVSMDGHAYTDGFEFGFIPVQSSFNYQAANPNDLDSNILNDAVADIMDNTPFDVVVTNPRWRNREHMHIENPSIGSYQTCSADTNIRSYLIPREIGDDSLYLENTLTLPHGALFEAEAEVLVNVRNPYYNYPSVNTTKSRYQLADQDNYIVSKEQPVTITSAPISLRANNAVLINPTEPLAGPYQILTGNMTICCENFLLRPSNNMGAWKLQKSKSMLEVFPNPSNDAVTIKYQFAQNAPVILSIHNLQGILIGNITMPFKNNSVESYFTIDLAKQKLPAGIYLIRLSTSKETLTTKVVKQ